VRTHAGIGRCGGDPPARRRVCIAGPALALALIVFAAGAPPAPAHNVQPPTALLHRFPLNPVRSPSTSPRRARSSGRTPVTGSRPARPHSTQAESSSGTIWLAVAAAAALLLLAGTGIGWRRRRLRASAGAHRESGPPVDKVVVQNGHGPEAPAAPDVAAREYRGADGAGDATGAFNLGAVLHQRGDLVGAISAYERAEERGDLNAAFNLGVLMYETGDLDGAAAAWRRCAGRNHPKAAANLGYLLQRQGDLEGARAAYLAAASWGDARGAGLAAALNGVGNDRRPTATP